VQKIFLSRPTTVTHEQSGFCSGLEDRLRDAGLEPQTVGVTLFGDEAPLLTVRRLMEVCHGAVVLGLAQLHVTTGVSKPGTPDEARVRSLRLPTPWNQLEAGIAFALDLPLLIVHETDVEPDGIFDPQIGDRFVHQTDLSPEWLDSDAFIQPFHQWVSEVKRR
jgi:hypothetical protein